MAKARVIHRSRPGFTINVGVLGGMMPLVSKVWSTRDNNFRDAGRVIASGMTGYDYGVKEWRLENMMHGIIPIGLGILASKLASRLGVNRALGRAGIPFVRI